MRLIKRIGTFRRDYKRELKGKNRKVLEVEFIELIEKLIRDQPLEAKYRDHALTGEWKDHRDCHIRPDLVLIYRKQGKDLLHLVRVGSNSELGL
jgi:mRNA interferase YafQ